MYESVLQTYAIYYMIQSVTFNCILRRIYVQLVVYSFTFNHEIYNCCSVPLFALTYYISYNTLSKKYSLTFIISIHSHR